MPTTEITDEESDTDSMKSGAEDPVEEEIVIATKKVGKKRKISTTSNKRESAAAAAAAVAMMEEEHIDEKDSDVMEESLAVKSTLKECLSLMDEMKRKASSASWVTSTPTTTPAGTSCFYCYCPDHYASFCSLKIKHNAERLASQKRVNKVAAAKKKVDK